jgi:site-specific recombinase XerD
MRADHVLNFLRRLESRRGNTASTRNARLSALRSFLRYAAIADPACERLAEQVARIPMKLGKASSSEPLGRDQVRALILAVSPASARGLRDRALLQFLYNTGARASEVCQLRVSQLTLDGPNPHVRLFGKGGRWRATPLLGSTPVRLIELLKRRRPPKDLQNDPPVFLNRAGQALTRQGVRQIVVRSARVAADRMPSLREKRVTTHLLRHTTATHMLRSGVDLSTVQSWLGHVHIDTTSGYVRYSALDARTAVEVFRRAVDFAGAAETEAPATDGLLDRWLDSL